MSTVALSPSATTLSARPAASPGRQALGLFLRNPSGIAGLAIILAIVLASVFGPRLYGVDAFDIAGIPFSPPGDDPLLGTDYLGRDIIAGLLQGGRATLLVGLVSAAITIVIGVSVGALAGFFGGRIDTVLMKLTEFFQVLPTLLFAMVLVTLFGQTLPIIALAIGIVSWPGAARLTRAEFLRIRGLDYVKAARAAGAGPGYLILRVVLPNAAPADRRHRDARHRHRDPVLERPELPRARRSQHHELGPDARPEPLLRPRRLVDGGAAGRRDLPGRARRQPPRRRL